MKIFLFLGLGFTVVVAFLYFLKLFLYFLLIATLVYAVSKL